MHAMHVHGRQLPAATSGPDPATSRNGERTVAPTTLHASTTPRILTGDARDVLATLPDGYADCIVTSPPYWAKRDYGVTGQYGHEHSPDAYIGTLRAVFGEARRVLAD